MLRAQRPALLRRPPSFATGASMAMMLRKNRQRSEEEEEDFPFRSSPVVAAAAPGAAAARNGRAAAADKGSSSSSSDSNDLLLLLSPDTPLAEALVALSPSSSLSASEEFAVDRLRARGVDTAGSLADLVREELLQGAGGSAAAAAAASSSSSSSSTFSSPLLLSSPDSAAAAAVATTTRLPSSVVAAVCAGVEAARKKGNSGPLASEEEDNQVLASVPRRRRKSSPPASPASSAAAAAPKGDERAPTTKKREQEELKSNVLTFRQAPDPSLTGAAAASANNRLLRAPPTDPRWAARAVAMGSNGGQPPLVDEAVRAVLTRRIPQGDRYFHGDPSEVRVTKNVSGRGVGGRGGSGRGGVGNNKVPKSSSPAEESYALHARDTPPQLARELEDFHRFWTVRFPGQQQQPVVAVTADKYVDHLRRMLGWAVSEGKVKRGEEERGDGKGASFSLTGGGDGEKNSNNKNLLPLPLSEACPPDLSLRDLIPSPSREGAALVMEYAAWLARARGVSPHTEGLAVRSALSAAKFLYHSESRARVAAGERPYQDLEVVAELRGMSREAREAGKRAPSASDESAKWLDWPDFLAVVEELRREAGAINERGRRRSDAAVAWALQKYLMFAILACVPDRQRTLRELELGRTLFYENGKWVIRHGAGDYKTGRVYGTRPPLQLDESLYPELHAYLSTWRACLNPKHDFVFTMKSGVRFIFFFFFFLISSTFLNKKQRKNAHSLTRSLSLKKKKKKTLNFTNKKRTKTNRTRSRCSRSTRSSASPPSGSPGKNSTRTSSAAWSSPTSAAAATRPRPSSSR